MPSYVVPHSLYADGYHCDPELPLPFISIASQSKHIGFYHMGLYADPDLLRGFEADWSAAKLGKLDMGKGCVRFRKPERLTAAMPVLGTLFSRMTPEAWIALYEATFKG